MIKHKPTLFDVFNYIFLGITALICLIPFINQLAVSLSSTGPVLAGEVNFIPKGLTPASYQFALSDGKFIRSFGISVVRVVLGVSLNLVLMVLTAYPLSRTKKDLPGRNLIIAFYVITMLIRGGMIPTYLVVSRLGLKDNILALILPGALPVYSMIILMNFIRGLPYELEEAAKIDGALPIQILGRVILPLLKPSLATVALFSIIGHWNDWFSGLIYMNNPQMYPLQTYLQSILQNFEQLMRNASSDEIRRLISAMNARMGRAAQLFLGAIPVMLVYPFLQKHFTTGLVLGSVKG